MSAITTKIVEKYILTLKMSDSELSQYASEFLENLTDDRKRNQARQRLRDGFKFSSKQVGVLIPNQRSGKNRYGFSEDQVNALFSIQKNGSRHSITTSDKNINIVIANQLSKGMEEETIGDMAQRILQDKLSIRDVRAEAYALAISAKLMLAYHVSLVFVEN